MVLFHDWPTYYLTYKLEPMNLQTNYYSFPGHDDGGYFSAGRCPSLFALPYFLLTLFCSLLSKALWLAVFQLYLAVGSVVYYTSITTGNKAWPAIKPCYQMVSRAALLNQQGHDIQSLLAASNAFI